MRYTALIAAALSLIVVAGCCSLAYATFLFDSKAPEASSTILPMETYFENVGLVPLPSKGYKYWFEVNGLESLAPNREIECKVGDEFVTVKVLIDESTVGCSEGRKNVFAQFRYSSRGGADFIWCSAIDRYTGTSFSSNPYSFEDALRFSVDGNNVGVFTSKTPETYFAGQYTQQVVINCPENYDGVVFQFAPVFGDSDSSITNSELHSIEDFSTWGSQLFFSMRPSQYSVQVLSLPDDLATLSVCVDDALTATMQ